MNLQPKEFMTDWECAMRKALGICYPFAVLRGCWYHYCAAIRLKALKLGLVSMRKFNPEYWVIVKMLMSIPLLPPDKILNGFEYIKKRAAYSRLITKLKAMFDYYENYWLNQV